MRAILFLIMIIFSFGCNRKTQSDLKGKWVIEKCLNKRIKFYPELEVLNDSTMLIVSIGDTILHCRYKIEQDSLLLYLIHCENKLIGKSKIIEFTPQYIKLDNLLGDDQITYYKK